MKKNLQILFLIMFLISIFIVFSDKISFLPERFKKSFSFGMDLAGGTILTYQIDFEKAKNSNRGQVLEQTKDMIERRINFLGVAEYFVSFSESGRILIEIPNIKNPEEAKKVIGETPFLEFKIPIDDKTFISSGLTGRYLENAEVGQDPVSLEPVVLLSFNKEGSLIFKNLTEKYLGKPIAIFLDNQIISAPIVKEVITNGKAVINSNGKFSFQEAKLLANRLKQGSLPVPIYLVGESVIDPLLGLKFLDLSLKGALLGILLVLIFMVVVYKFNGFLADIALIFFIFYNLALYKMLGVTISLASLAGLVLAVGMAVDANILIFERMKEERAKNLKDSQVIEEGFKRAFPSIRDSNMTTIISSLIMYFLATSFVKGFALTLFFGVLISFLTAVFFSRYLLETFYFKNGFYKK
jgi:preprotein translocase subunit SecD